MCVKTCLCNSCYKKNSCVGCEYIDNHKDADCRTEGITECENYIVKQ